MSKQQSLYSVHSLVHHMILQAAFNKFVVGLLLRQHDPHLPKSTRSSICAASYALLHRFFCLIQEFSVNFAACLT